MFDNDRSGTFLKHILVLQLFVFNNMYKYKLNIFKSVYVSYFSREITLNSVF